LQCFIIFTFTTQTYNNKYTFIDKDVRKYALGIALDIKIIKGRELV